MRSARFFSAIVFLILVAQSVAATQESSGESRLLEAIKAAGYSYREEGEHSWRVEREGKELKLIPVVISLQDGKLFFYAIISEERRIQSGARLWNKIKELNRLHAPAAFLTLPDDHLFAVLKAPPGEVSADKLREIIEGIAKLTDETYPEIRPFVGKAREAGETRPTLPRRIPVREPYLPVAGSPDVLPSGTVDSKPVLLNKVRPNYTVEARQNQVEGVVILRIVIDTNGDVAKVTVLSGLPDGLDDEAILAAKKLKFKPAMKFGKPVSFSTRVEVEFNLSDDK